MIKHPGEKKSLKEIPSSTVILFKQNMNNFGSMGNEVEIYLAKRRFELKNFPGVYAGIGGKIEPQDKEFARQLLSKNLFHSDNEERLTYKVCAWRELLEETGLFYYDSVSETLLKQIKEYVKKSNSLVNLAELFRIFDLKHSKVLLEYFRPAGYRTTPEFTNIIFQTQFYIVPLISNQLPEITPDHPEFSEGNWESPKEFLMKFQTFSLNIPPPILGVIRALVENDHYETLDSIHQFIPETAIKKLSEADKLPIGCQIPIEVHPGIEMIPFLSFTRPPATTTNLISIGDKKRIIIDPGANSGEEQVRLDHIIDHWLDNGNEVMMQIITHFHSDHYASAQHLREKYTIPIASYKTSAPSLHDSISTDIFLSDGQLIDLDSIDLYSHKQWQIRVLHTPGHTQGHLGLLDLRFNAFIAGDLIAGQGTVVIEDLRTYLDTLHKLSELPISVVLPGHGPMIYDGKQIIQQYISHRKLRGEQILAFLQNNGEQTALSITKHVYQDVPVSFLEIANHQVEVYIKYFVEERLIEPGLQNGTWKIL